jgi:hypothetical protein
MSDLTSIEKIKIEKYLGMESGYVLDFSNRTFQEFILENTGLDIYDDKYNYASGSKANRLRALWKKEPNYIVGKLLKDFVEYWEARKLISYPSQRDDDTALKNEVLKIASRLIENSPIENIDAIRPITDEKDFTTLANTIRESIYKNQPELALDRLHTFVTKYIRVLCHRHGVVCDRSKPLHSIFGEYIKKLKEKGAIQSVMTERILKMSISILESFNDVRNNQSFAHDNTILNFNESVLIFNNVSSTIRFIESIEKALDIEKKKEEIDTEWNDIPF